MNQTNVADASSLHRESIIIDAVCPLVMDDAAYLDWYRDGGVTVLAPTVGGWERAEPTLARIAAWHRLLRVRDDVLLVETAVAAQQAKRDGKIGIFLHMQGADPIEDNLDLIDLYKALGVGMIQLTYNVVNRAGSGCEVDSDEGLTSYGRAVVERLNACKVIVDCSHTGLRTSFDAIERSKAPVVLSHSNPASVHASARNVPDALIDAIAKTGGLIGIAGFPAMVAPHARPTLDDFARHIDAIVQRVGCDHVGLGIDYYWGQAGVASDAAASESYREAVAAGRWSDAYPPPPHHYPQGIETPRALGALTACLLQRGYSGGDVRKILGGNWLRVMREVWGA